MSIFQTIGIGILGSLLAGLISLAFFGRTGGGLVHTVACATLLVYVVRRTRGQGLENTRRRPGNLG
jgi:uncharacterized membrane protein YeaQ/YmgE (transglycosylase-associated protein family)